MAHHHRRIARLALLALGVLLVAACGAEPQAATEGDDSAAVETAVAEATGDTGEATAAESEPVAAPDSFEAVFAAVEGMDWEERTDTLLELAEAEGGVVNWYTSMQADMGDALAEAFTEQYGVGVEQYRASRDAVLRRIQEEDTAGFAEGADVVELTGAEIAELARGDLLEPYDSEAEDGLVETAIFDSWNGVRQTLLASVWNTAMVPEEERPTTLADFAEPRWRGSLQLDVQYAPWYKTAWEHLVEDEGYTPEEADQLFQTIVTDAIAIRPPSVALNLMSAGDFSGILAAPTHSTDRFIADGAPVAYKPFVEPVIIEPNGNALVRNAGHPAAAVLFQDWILTDGQVVLRDFGVPPTRADLFAELGLDEVDTLLVDVEEFIEDGDEWFARWTELARLAEHREPPPSS